MSFAPEAHELLERVTREQSDHAARSGEPARAWLVQQHMSTSHRAGRAPLIQIDDRTEDFDFPRDLLAWEATRMK